MNTNEIKEKLKSKEYDFLRIDKHLGKNIIFLTTGGSYAYGTNVETSDLDIRGIAVETSNEILGSAIFEQFEDRKTDTVVYALRKILKLMLNCNPNVLEILGTKDEHIFICNKYGKMIKDNKDLFLSKRAIQSFGGYASAQLRRLQNALARDNYPQREKEIHILNTIKTQIATMKDRYEVFSKENLNIYIDKSKKEDFESELFIDVNFKHYPLRDFKNIYAEMSNVIKDYDKLNHRNSKKDTNHLNKHAMHLIRLFLMGTELLEGKGINTYREKDREFLLKIRKGEFSYSEIFEMVNDYEKKFDYAAKNTSLKDEPDYDKVEEEIRTLKKACGNHILKVIIETCYLTEDEKIAMCKAVTNAGADYIKTSTGFGTGGATIEDIRLFKQHIGPDVKMKAAGGVKSKDDLIMFLEAGCDRIGTSSAVGLLKGEQAKGY